MLGMPLCMEFCHGFKPFFVFDRLVVSLKQFGFLLHALQPFLERLFYVETRTQGSLWILGIPPQISNGFDRINGDIIPLAKDHIFLFFGPLQLPELFKEINKGLLALGGIQCHDKTTGETHVTMTNAIVNRIEGGDLDTEIQTIAGPANVRNFLVEFARFHRHKCLLFGLSHDIFS